MPPSLETVRWALGVYAGLLLGLIGLRAALVRRRTGRNPFPALVRFEPSFEMLGLLGMMMWVALVLRYAVEGPFEGPALGSLGSWAIKGERYRLSHGAGLAAIAAGGAVFAAAIAKLGESWRIGVDREGSGNLVTSGIYRFVRHPIYTGLQVGSAGVFLMAPNWVFLASVPLMVLGTRRQALVEEAWLLERFPAEYRAYARRTGRFLPGIGRLASA